MAEDDFNIREARAKDLTNAGRFRDALAIYFRMADGDPSLDAGYLGMKIGECYEQLGDLDAAWYWYGRAAEENPGRTGYVRARRRVNVALTLGSVPRHAARSDSIPW